MSSAAPTLDDVLRATSGIGARLERIEDRLGALEKQEPRPVPSGASPQQLRRAQTSLTVGNGGSAALAAAAAPKSAGDARDLFDASTATSS